MATSTKTKKRTWRQWLLDSGRDEATIDALAGPRWTRDGVLHEARKLGAPITDAMLRRWEAAGALPGPERKWYPPEGAVMAFYPGFMPQLVKIANDLHRGEGRALSEIGPLVADRLEDAIREAYQSGTYEPSPTSDLMEALRVYAIARGKDLGPVGRIRLFLDGPDGEQLDRLVLRVPEQLHDS